MKKIFAMLLCLCMLVGVFTACATKKPDSTDDTTVTTKGTETTSTTDTGKTEPAGKDDDKEKENEALKAKLKEDFLKAANEVIVTEDSVTFKDATSTDGSTVTVKKVSAMS